MKLKILAIIGLTIFSSSCESILDIEPRQSVDASKALQTAEGVSASLTNLYSYFKNTLLYGRDFVATAEALGDNADIIDRAGGRYQSQGTNVPNSHLGNWATAYAAINEINLLLEALPTAAISATVRDEVEGQVRAMRALLYFDLIRAYAYEPGMAPSAQQDRGGVPIMLKGVLQESQIVLPARSSSNEVYAQIYADLTLAIQKAPKLGAPVYITRTAAHALFAKVALYNKDWTTAEDQATKAIALQGILSTNTNYVSDWRASSHRESIFEVTFKNTNENIGVNESVQSAFTTRVSIDSDVLGGYGAVVPNTAFLNLFPEGDVRRPLYQTGVARSNKTVIECTKFMGKTGTTYMDNIPVIRVSEVYLIRAEARAQIGNNDSGAMADLNAIAIRSNLTVTGLTGDALLMEIYKQRRLELAFEGDRWFDLKRRGQDVIKSTGNVLFNDYRILAPIPVRETQSNPNLVQNFKY